MGNPILTYLRDRLGVSKPDYLWLLTLLTVLPLDRFSLSDWNAALSALAGRNLSFPTYKHLISHLQRLSLGVK